MADTQTNFNEKPVIPMTEATRRRLMTLVMRDRKRRLAGSHADWWAVVKPGIEYRVAQDLYLLSNLPGTQRDLELEKRLKSPTCDLGTASAGSFDTQDSIYS